MTAERRQALPDDAVRREVLDPGRSFLVQAPAGAGKTELLIRRYLVLLAAAEEPEEVLAITFTRKAAGEMRRRVLEALQAPSAARNAEVATAGAAASTADLAAAVRARDGAAGWRLLEQPSRLRILTIDSLNRGLAQSAPVTSGGNALRPVSETPQELYVEAADRILELLGENAAIGDALADLLTHLDNRVSRLRSLLADLLERRDQWLPVLGAGAAAGAGLRRRLEGNLRRIVADRVHRFASSLPADLLAEVSAVVAEAERHLHPEPLPADADELQLALRRWRRTGHVLLTKDGEWRKRVDKNQGFPPTAKAAKERALALLERLAEDPELARQLAETCLLPDPMYSDEQWRALDALVRVLPLAAAQLRLVFAERGVTDFSEVAADALRALGTEGEPGAQALRLDRRIRHVLMDEFQDSSQAQYGLLAALTRGWVRGDGRTLFLVGDPMQSVYRFRQAEVRLFLDARGQGLPEVPLEFRRLQSNFRSVPAIVDWVNASFAGIFPADDNLLVSAVSYAPASAVKDGEGDTGVFFHDFTEQGAPAEGEQVANLVRDTLQRWPDQTIGILVRNRSHARASLHSLRSAGIPCVAVELLHLGDTSLAADLQVLTRAVFHPGDRLAALAALRAPWCGLTLTDLAALVEPAPRDVAISELLGDPTTLARVSADGRKRLGRWLAAWERARARRGRVDLRDLVEGLWLELGGPAFAGAEIDYADELFRFIARHESAGDCPDPEGLREELAQRAASVPGSAGRVQILTIHKAKGLQFDTVIVPSLGARSRTDDRPALLWEDYPAPGGARELLLAPINGAGTKEDRLYELLWDLKSEQSRAEIDRLLYVAATRAVRRLHWLGARRSGSVPPTPHPGSLLDRLWPAVANAWPPAPEPAMTEVPTLAWRQPPLRRLPAGWQRPQPPPPVAVAASPEELLAEPIAFDWAGLVARHSGTVVHRWLQHFAKLGIESVNAGFVRNLAPQLRQDLLGLGVPEGDVAAATARVESALAQTLGDERGRWLLSNRHAEVQSEWELTRWTGTRFERVVVDRAFVTPDGVRWIVDYKTSSHEGGDEAAFLAAEAERYRGQLRRYRLTVEALESRPVETALYFPLLGRLLLVDTRT